MHIYELSFSQKKKIVQHLAPLNTATSQGTCGPSVYLCNCSIPLVKLLIYFHINSKQIHNFEDVDLYSNISNMNQPRDSQAEIEEADLLVMDVYCPLIDKISISKMSVAFGVIPQAGNPLAPYPL